MENFKIVAGWIFGIILIAVGIANTVLVHIVPGVAYFVISLVYLPPVSELVESRFKIKIPVFPKIVLAVVVIMFTLGVSDLGEMIDKSLA